MSTLSFFKLITLHRKSCAPPSTMVQPLPISPTPSAGSAPDAGPTTRTRSNQSRPQRLSRILSGQHLDDHSHYHHHDFEGDGDYSSDSEDTLNENEKDPQDPAEQKGEVPEGAASQQDLEAGAVQLEKKKTSRSVKDPNLVSRASLCANTSKHFLIVMGDRSPGMDLMIPRTPRIGLARGNGLQHWWFRLSLSSLRYHPQWWLPP